MTTVLRFDKVEEDAISWKNLRKCCYDICTYNPRVRRRNTKITVTISGMCLSCIYAGMGIVSLGRCPAQPMVPIWAMVTGLLLGALFPVIVCCLAERVGSYLKSSLNEDINRDLCDWIRKEARTAMGLLKLVMSVLVVGFAIAWWMMGCYLVYSVYSLVETSDFLQGRPDTASPNYCDPVVYTITLEIVSLAWFTLCLCVLWVVAYLCYDERFRMSVSDLLRYEVIHPSQLSYDLHRHRETVSRKLEKGRTSTHNI